MANYGSLRLLSDVAFHTETTLYNLGTGSLYNLFAVMNV